MLEGERKTVTALFADIKGSMELIEDLDPEEARTLVDPALKLMMDAVHRYEGYVAQSTGDGIFALFGAPCARGPSATSPSCCPQIAGGDCNAIRQKLRAWGQPPLSARVGVNSGEVVVRSIHDRRGAYGIHADRAFDQPGRAAADPRGAGLGGDGGECSEICRRLLHLKSLGASRIKGVSEPVEVYEVTGLGPLRTRLQRSVGRGLTKFVGRRREMDTLKNAAEQANSGHGQIVAAIAEAGVGKSRLFHEFKAISRSGYMVLEAFSFSHGKASALLPVIELLWSYFKITSDDDERTRREKITGRALALDRSMEDALPYLYALLGLTDENNPLGEIEPQIGKRRALEAIKRILLRESLNQPLVVIFEDLHWIDDESQVFLNLLADSIGTAKILLLVNYRPEYSHQWNSKTYYTQLRLDPLGRESAEEMLTALLSDGLELGPLKRLIIEKTEGNPFFMEEMALMLFEEGVLVRNGAVKLTRSLSQLKTPPTVQAILAARIDRLPPDGKELLQTLAVIGKEFPLNLVREVAGARDLERELDHLQLAEFIYEQPAVGEVEYTFKHALTLEVAYSSLLVERRRGLHQRVAEAVESLHVDRLEDHYAELARHFDRSGDRDNATRYLYLAGQQALARSAFHEALDCAARGLELVGSLPESPSRAERELRLRVALGGALYWVEGPASEAGGAALARARELSLIIGNKEEGSSAVAGLAHFHMFRAELQQAVETGREAVKMAHGTKYLRLAHATLGRILLQRGEFRESVENLERTLSLPESQSLGLVHLSHSSHQGSHAMVLNFLSSALWFRGFPDQAMRRSCEALQMARDSRNSPLLSVVLIFAADFFIRYGEEDRLRESIETLAAVAAELEPTPAVPPLIEIRKGWLLAESGELQKGIDTIRNGIARLLATGCKYHDSFHRALLALAYLRDNQVDNAFGSLDDALRFVEQTGERFNEAELHRLRGELLLARGRASDEEEMQGCFRKAIGVARGQDAKSWELRATMSLARLLAMQGRRDEARAMLAEIYGWFTEGFDTADLKEAKALLDKLNA